MKPVSVSQFYRFIKSRDDIKIAHDGCAHFILDTQVNTVATGYLDMRFLDVFRITNVQAVQNLYLDIIR